jgi:hypothetical protein
VGFVRILTKSTLVLVTEVLRLVLPIRSHPINPIRSSPAGGGSGFFPGTGGTHRGTVQNPGALRGRLGAGVVAYVPLIRALVTLSRAPRETAVFPVHCSPSSLPGRYASAAYTPVCGGTTGNMPRIPGGGASVCVGMRRYASVWFTCEVRVFGTECHGTARLKWCAMFRFVSLCSGPCFALGRLHCPAAAGLRGCAMWRYVAPCRGPEISGGPGRLSSGTAAGSAALSSHCFALGGIFFREPGRLPGAGARIRAG